MHACIHVEKPVTPDDADIDIDDDVFEDSADSQVPSLTSKPRSHSLSSLPKSKTDEPKSPRKVCHYYIIIRLPNPDYAFSNYFLELINTFPSFYLMNYTLVMLVHVCVM